MSIESTAEQPLSVADVSRLTGSWVERLGSVWVEGQVSQLSKSPGMVFVSLRDLTRDITIKLKVYRRDFERISGVEQGSKIRALIKPEWYAQRGELSFMASALKAIGLGELLAELENLKRKLAAEGLFDQDRKKKLPFLPNCIGLVTGKDSAAELDVLENARRRWPNVNFKVQHARMQGEYTTREVGAALFVLGADPEVDVIVIARGGGAVEEVILPFSDEELIRLVAKCRKPIVSAIGHEPDNPLLDLVADLRASTPTDAAKRVVPDVYEETDAILGLYQRSRDVIYSAVQREEQWLASLASRPCMADPENFLIGGEKMLLDILARQLNPALERILEQQEAALAALTTGLDAMSPEAVFRRGYAAVRLASDGRVIYAPDQVEVLDVLRITVGGGEFNAVVTGEQVVE